MSTILLATLSVLSVSAVVLSAISLWLQRTFIRESLDYGSIKKEMGALHQRQLEQWDMIDRFIKRQRVRNTRAGKRQEAQEEEEENVVPLDRAGIKAQLRARLRASQNQQ